MNGVVSAIAELPPISIYGCIAAVVLVESVLLLGTFAPTLALLLTAGALADRGVLLLPVVIVLATSCAVCGDCLARLTGAALGPRLHTSRLGRRIPAAAWRRATVLMDSYGGAAVFFGRFIPVVRTVTPYLAGATGLRYRRIAVFSVVAAAIWASAEICVGYFAAASLDVLLAKAGTGVAIAAACLVVLLLIVIVVYRRRSAR
ncbi:DedA family protein [Sciscionella sediminilitoris]|uniref:DedA family protein n=1 Tax=Sciscionella sediminilitoris TaxID=1445613 RepID=UPI0004DFCAD3|nr:VTT domain-containing protein [Sciscionella sp. SE31]